MQGRDAGLTPQEKLEFWTGLAAKLKDSSLRKAEFEMLVYGSERSLPIRDRSGKIVGFREVQGGGGDASLAASSVATLDAVGDWRSASRDQEAAQARQVLL
jgi:hypothetical protein